MPNTSEYGYFCYLDPKKGYIEALYCVINPELNIQIKNYKKIILGVGRNASNITSIKLYSKKDIKTNSFHE